MATWPGLALYFKTSLSLGLWPPPYSHTVRHCDQRDVRINAQAMACSLTAWSSPPSSAQSSTNTESRAVDNVTSQNTLPPRLFHVYDVKRGISHDVKRSIYLRPRSGQPEPHALLVIVPCHPSRVCASRPSSLGP